MHDGLQVLIDGMPVGNWEPNYKACPITYIERQKTALSLSAFIKKNGLKKLLVLSSERGESDYMSPVNDNGLQKVWQNVRCKYSNRDSILNDLKQAIKQHKPKGIVFIRGGADTAKTMQMWDDSEFIAEIMVLDVHIYAAVGHSDKHFMIDKYADESFASPGDFGHKLAKTYQHLQTEQYINQENTRLSQRCDQLDNLIDQIKKRHIKNILIYTTVSVILTGVLFIFFVDDYDSLSQIKSIFS